MYGEEVLKAVGKKGGDILLAKPKWRFVFLAYIKKLDSKLGDG